MATGDGFTLIVTEDGNICTSGNNMYGQLGIGDFEVHQQPCVLKHVDTFGGHEVVMVAAGAMMSACVTKDGSLWTWGYNAEGVLGHLHPSPLMDRSQCRPRRLCMSLHGNSPVQMVACGFRFTLVLTISGQIWSFGQGVNYELGHGVRETTAVPKCIDPALFDGAEIGMIATGGHHSLALSKTGGKVWGWGYNSFGQTGAGNTESLVRVPTLIPEAAQDGDLMAFVSCGFDFSMLVTVNGVVWSCGNNGRNKAGLGDNVAHSLVLKRVAGDEYFGPGGIRMVSCGFTHTMLVAKNNTVWTCGSGENGVLARGFNRIEEGVGGKGRPCLVDSATFSSSDSEILSDNDVLVVVAGKHSSFAVTSGGVVYLWGKQAKWVHQDSEPSYPKPNWFSHIMPAWALGLAENSTEYARPGRWHDMRRDCTTAFVMGTHPNFARNATSCYNSDFPEELLRDMFRSMRFAVREGSSEGVQALLGCEVDE